MPVLCAFWLELRRSLDFRGRTARARYFGFMSVAISVFASASWIAVATLPDGQGWVGILVLIALFYVPVTSAGVRRLHDTGNPVTLMLDPLKPLAAFGVIAFLIGVAFLSSDVGILALFASLFLAGKIMAALVVIAALLMLGLTMIFFSHTMGQLMLPSQPGTNTYGPDPHQVPA